MSRATLRWVFAAIVVLSITTFTASAQAQGWTLSGTVYGGGSPLPNTIVEALQDGTTTAVAAATADASGRYSLTLVNATYDLRVTPPTGSGFGVETIQNITINGADRTYDVILLSAGGAISGTVRGLNAAPLAGVSVNVYSSSWQYLGSGSTDANGQYSVSASGTVILSFNGGWSPLAPSNWSANRYNLQVSGPTTFNLDLPLATLSGVVRGNDGATIGNASITASSNRYENDLAISGNTYATAAADGTYSLLMMMGSASFNVYPPAGTTYSPYSVSGVSITGDETRDFTLTSASPVSGTVRGLGGAPLPGVSVNVYSSSWQYLGSGSTDANGQYSIPASGTVILSFNGGWSPLAPSNWSANRYNLQVSGPTTFNLDLPLATLSGVVRGNDGAAVGNASITASSNRYENDLAISGNTYATAAADGTYSLLMMMGSASFNVYPPAGTYYSPFSVSGVSITGDEARDFTLTSASPISGTVRGLGGAPLQGVSVNAYSSSWQYLGSGSTDANGQYSIPASGTVILSFNGGWSPLAPSNWSANRYNLQVSGPTTFDLTLPIVTVTGSTTDSNGAGVGSVSLTGSSNRYADDLALSSTSYATTGADGAYALHVLAGSGSFNVYPPSASGFQPVSLSNLQFSTDLTQRIILQRPDLSPPQIVAGPVVVHLSDDSVSVSWTTNEAATSRVEYSGGSTWDVVADSTLRTNHEITLRNLSAFYPYDFRVCSSDGSGNGPTCSAIASFTTQAYPGDITPPTITAGPTVSAIDQTSAIIQWTTSEPASSVVSWGTSPAFGQTVASADGRFTVTHSVRLTGLTAETSYHAQVSVADPDSNTATSSVFTFTTLAVPDTNAPVITAGPTVLSKTDTKITVTWTTNEPATSGVSYNDGTRYDLVNDTALVAVHEVTLSGLSPMTTYSITVSSKDAASNGPTLSETISVTTEAAPDTTPPTISNVSIVSVPGSSTVEVSWTTDEAATSAVRYGTTSGAPDSVQSRLGLVTTHEITLSGLASSTLYYFTVESTDASGNKATHAEVPVTTGSATVDEAPTSPGPITAPPATKAQSFEITWGASTDDIALASYDILRDGVVVATVPATITSYTEDGLAEGSYSYTIRATDSAGQTATSAAVTVVIDRTPPAIAADDKSVEAAGEVTVVAYTVTATDAVDGAVSVSCSPASGSSFTVGTTLVQCTAVDASGNEGSASFSVIVTDTTAPLLNVPTTVSREATGSDGAAVSYTASASDLVDGDVTVTCLPASGSLFAVGTTTVDCSATDAAGNVGSASFEVAVVDTTPPVVTVPADITAEATAADGASVVFGATATDLVSGTFAATCAPSSGATFQLGTTTVMCSGTDAAGNIGSAAFRVTVRDTTPPALEVPADLTLEATSSSGATSVFTVIVADLVTPSLAATCSPASGSVFPIGTTTVTCSATDGSGNTGEGSFKVTVRDTTPPAIASVVPSRAVLWPPDHRMVPMTVAVAVSDVVDANPVCYVATITSNEVIDGLGDGDTAPDWLIGSGLSFQLRAERSGKGAGRTYTINVECGDGAGNRSRKSATVSVPKDAAP